MMKYLIKDFHCLQIHPILNSLAYIVFIVFVIVYLFITGTEIHFYCAISIT